MFGANGSAVDGGGLLQLRALDWNVDGENACTVMYIVNTQTCTQSTCIQYAHI